MINRIKNLGSYYRASGDNAANWQGGIRKDERGYIRVWVGKNKWKYQHRIIMEKHLGRELKFDETIHHINGNKSDNRTINMVVISRSEHSKKFNDFSKKGKYVNCLRCNKLVYKEPFILKLNKKMFCSRFCSQTYKKENHCY